MFEQHYEEICSLDHELSSDQVLGVIRAGLEQSGYMVERSKRSEGRLRVPVLFGRNGRIDKCFDTDALYRDPDTGQVTILEVEAGRGYTNNQFLKDLFEACMMQNVCYLAIAVRLMYKHTPDFDRITFFFDTLYSSGRLTLPLEGVLVLGY